MRALLLAALLGLPVALAHPGEPGDPLVTPMRLEAERYKHVLGRCDPTLIGDHTRVEAFAGELAAVVPSWGCRLSYGMVEFTKHSLYQSAIARFTDNSGFASGDVMLYVDGVLHGNVYHYGSLPWNSWVTRAAQDQRWILAGTHNITIAYEGGNMSPLLWLDALVFETTDAPCVNEIPRPPTSIVADGFGAERDRAWRNHSYTFTAVGASDPEGDPLLYEWNFGAWGQTATSSYPTPGIQAIWVRVHDDPSARCPEAPSRSVRSGEFSLWVYSDWWTVQPLQDEHDSCLLGGRFYTAAALIVGRCELYGYALGGAFGTVTASDGLEAIRHFVDGELVPPTGVTTADYNSLHYAPGTHRLDTCAYARNDKFEREFCAQPYWFLNVGVG